MKKFRKLIPALCMLLISAMLMGTSTYAWFSMNTTVTATGMQVKASASEALAISDNGTVYSNTMALATKATELYPVSMVDNASTAIGTTVTQTATKSSTLAGDISFYTINYDNNQVNDPNNSAAVTTLSQFLADQTTHAGKFTVDSTNYVSDELWIKYTAESGSKAITLTISVHHTAGATADLNRDMENAFHIALVNAETNEVWNYDITNFTDKQSSGSGNYDVYEISIAAFVTLTANTAQHYTVYAWYEGEDTDCTTANAISVTDLTVDLKFTIPTV